MVDGLLDPMVSIVTHTELLVPCGNAAEEQAILAFLQNFITLPLDDAVVLETARLKRHLLQTGAKKMQMPDMIIRASATVHGATIYTLNTRDFPAGPNVVHPYSSVPNTAPKMRQQAAAVQSAAGAANVTCITAAQPSPPSGTGSSSP